MEIQMEEPAWIKTLVAKLQTLSDQQICEAEESQYQDTTNGNSLLENEQILEVENEELCNFESVSSSNLQKDFLRVPKLKHNYLMSPPPSPPENWVQGSEEINRVPYVDLEPRFLADINQTILFQGHFKMELDSNNSPFYSMPSSQLSSESSSGYSSLNSSTSSLQSYESPKLRTKRKQDDTSRLPSGASAWLDDDPSVMQEKEERRRRKNLRQNGRQVSFSSTSTSYSRFGEENQSSSSEEEANPPMFVLPSIVVTHNDQPTTFF